MTHAEARKVLNKPLKFGDKTQLEALKILASCEACNGTGREMDTCPTCDGSGEVFAGDCEKCDGTGEGKS